MITTIPASIGAYFLASNRHDVDETLAWFTPTARVVDEGEAQELVGYREIRDWLESSIASYKLKVEALDSHDEDGETIVATLVSGDFPGSPIQFNYHFYLEGGLISGLTIK